MGNKTENATVKTAAFINNENRNNKNISVKKMAALLSYSKLLVTSLGEENERSGSIV